MPRSSQTTGAQTTGSSRTNESLRAASDTAASVQAASDTASRSLSQEVDSIYRRRRRFGLRRRSVLAVSVLVAVVLLMAGLVLLFFAHDHLEREARRQARSYAALATPEICQAFSTYHRSGSSKLRYLLIETARLDRSLRFIEIFDTEADSLYRLEVPDELVEITAEDEKRLADAGFELDDALRETIRGLEPKAWGRTDGVPVAEIRYVVAQPYVEDWGRHRLSVVFGFDERFVTETTHGFMRRLALVMALGLGLAVSCAYLLAGQSLRPLERLIRGARILSKGRLDHRIELESKDEFEVLAATLNHMAELLSGTVGKLESSNRRLEDFNQELQELDRVKSDLLANVSHELRTPLTAIGGYVEAMSAGLLGDVSPVQDDALVVMDRNIHRLRDMIDQLLSYSRLDAGQMELEMRPFDVEAVARHVAEAVSAARGEAFELDVQIDGPLPEVWGDAARISQVLENLLTNAAKFSPPDRAVELRLRAVGEGVEITVRDHGIGIPEDLQKRIFDRFFQVDAAANRAFGGMGLGLAIVKEIVELHHSEIQVDSRPGEGSAFRFHLPFSTERTGWIATAEGRRLLLIDDDGPGVQRLCRHLSTVGWTVSTAAGVEQGSILARREKPDVILLDRLLPDGDGFDLVSRLRNDEVTRDIPIVLFTVRPERGLGLRLGATDYWVKPLDGEEVERRLNHLMGRLQSSPDDAGGTVGPA